MIIFKKLRWKNFLSTGKNFTEFDFLADKTTLIMGDNGAGKSTMMDALSFVLYGKSFRNLTHAKLVNSINKKSCVVEVEFSVGLSEYMVRRGLKPNVLEIFRDGILINREDVRDYQSLLEDDILKINQKSFTQIVILGSANYVPFMKLTPAVRRGVIEDILDLAVFSAMNELLKDRVRQNKENLAQTDTNIHVVRSKIELNKKHIEALKSSNKELIEAKQEKIKYYEGLVNDSEKEISTVNEVLQVSQAKLDEVSDRLAKFSNAETLVNRVSSRIKSIEKEIQFYETNTNCPTCTQVIEESFRNSILDSHRGKMDTQTDALREALKLVEKSNQIQQEYNKINVEYLRHTKLLSDLKFSKVQNTRFINDLLEEINLLNSRNELVEVNDESAVLTADLDKLLNTKEKLLEDRDVIGVATQLLKDGGIKSLVIKQYIPEINRIVNKYLDALGFFVQFELDENFDETIKSRYRDDFSYENFSEGEKARIDLSLLFTWREIAKLRNSISTNLLIMDEVFDGSMDAMGSDELINLLRVLTENSNVVIISHNQSLLEKFDSVVRFKKIKNFSYMEKI